MKIYKFYENHIASVEIIKETKMFYFAAHRAGPFGWSSRIEKKTANLTPQEAIQEALNHSRTMYGAYVDKAREKDEEITRLEVLQEEYGLPEAMVPAID